MKPNHVTNQEEIPKLNEVHEYVDYVGEDPMIFTHSNN